MVASGRARVPAGKTILMIQRRRRTAGTMRVDEPPGWRNLMPHYLRTVSTTGGVEPTAKNLHWVW